MNRVNKNDHVHCTSKYILESLDAMTAFMDEPLWQKRSMLNLDVLSIGKIKIVSYQFNGWWSLCWIKLEIGVTQSFATFFFALLGQKPRLQFCNCTCSEKKKMIGAHIQTLLGSISPTFYVRLFLYESFVQSFFVLAVKVTSGASWVRARF